jgi:flagellar operon protein (TIGR03826 family)
VQSQEVGKVALVNCRSCGGLYDGRPNDLCPACRRLDAENFERIRKYLREHEGATVEEVSEATEVSVQRILGYLREGRLIERINASYPCEACGAVIHAGRLCAECRETLGNEVHQVAIDLAAERKNEAVLRSHYHARRPYDERT